MRVPVRRSGSSSGWARWWSTSRRMTSMASHMRGPLLGTEVDALEHEVAQLVHDGQGRRRPCAPRRRRGSCSTTAVIMPPIQALPTRPEALADGGREVVLREQPGPDGVERVVGEVRDAVGVPDAHRLLGRGRRLDLPGVGADAVAHLPGQVEVLQHLEDAHALRRVVPATGAPGSRATAPPRRCARTASGRRRGPARSPRRGSR